MEEVALYADRQGGNKESYVAGFACGTSDCWSRAQSTTESDELVGHAALLGQHVEMAREVSWKCQTLQVSFRVRSSSFQFGCDFIISPSTVHI